MRRGSKAELDYLERQRTFVSLFSVLMPIPCALIALFAAADVGWSRALESEIFLAALGIAVGAVIIGRVVVVVLDMLIASHPRR
jgi:p-aminobenzoyl-glutamate transporter AbgT